MTHDTLHSRQRRGLALLFQVSSSKLGRDNNTEADFRGYTVHTAHIATSRVQRKINPSPAPTGASTTIINAIGRGTLPAPIPIFAPLPMAAAWLVVASAAAAALKVVT